MSEMSEASVLASANPPSDERPSTSQPSAPGPVRRKLAPALRLPVEERLRVNEIFYSIQGESTFAGQPCLFLRLTGCQMRCRWCDTVYSFHEGSWMSVEDVLARVDQEACRVVEVTGGEPLLQPATRPLVKSLCDRGYEVLIETGGGVDIGGLDSRARRIVDIKCPGSGEVAKNHWPNLDLLTARDEVKFVIADRADYEWALGIVREHGLVDLCPVHLSPVWSELAPEQLAEWVLEDRSGVRLQLQVHKILWGDQRGV